MAFVLGLGSAGSEAAGKSPAAPDKSLRGAVFAVLEDQLDSARRQVELAADPATSDKAAAEAVHEARKSLKRLRATLRLLRRGLGRKRVSRAGRQLAEVGRALAATREAQVTNDVLRDLKRACAVPRPVEPARELTDEAAAVQPPEYAGYGQAVATAQKVYRELPQPKAIRPSPAVRDQVVGELAAAQKRVAGWSLRGKVRRTLQDGLERAVRRARRAWDVACAPGEPEHTAEQFHDLRKRVKDLYYTASLLTPAQPAELAALAEKLDQLADLLGDDHDLAVLAEQARARPDEFGGAQVVTQLLALAASRQRALREAVRPLADSLHELRPRRFARSVARGLHLRRADSERPAAEEAGAAAVDPVD